jgi:hypothetical protein
MELIATPMPVVFNLKLSVGWIQVVREVGCTEDLD